MLRQPKARAYLALREYKGLRDEAVRISAVGETGSDTDENAVIFLRSIVEYGAGSGSHTVVLTTDRALTEACLEAELDHFLFRIPQRLLGRDITARKFLSLIRLVSCVYGFMRLNGVLIIGEYGGKLQRDELKVFLGGRRAEHFGRDLVTSRRLMKRLKGMR